MREMLAETLPVVATHAWSAISAPHHGDPAGAVAVDEMWLRILTMVALIVVTAVVLLRPFDHGLGTRARTVAVIAAFVAVVGELALAPGGANRLDPEAAVLPVVLVTTALAMLPVVDWMRPGRLAGYLAGGGGVLALVLGTYPAALGELLSGNWSGDALRVSALAWVAGLAWFTLATPRHPAGTRAVWVVGFVVAVAVVAAIPGFTATGVHHAASFIKNMIVNQSNLDDLRAVTCSGLVISVH